MQSINAYVQFRTRLNDSTTGVQSLSENVLITKKDMLDGKLFAQLSRSTYVTEIDGLLFPDEMAWLKTLFMQDRSPETCTILYWNPAETFISVLQRAYELGANMYFLHYIGKTVVDIPAQLEIAEASKALDDRFQCTFMTNDPSCLMPDVTTDLGSRLKALAANNCSVFYQPDSVELFDGSSVIVTDTSMIRPDAALYGEMSTGLEGLEQWAFKSLQGVLPAVTKQADIQILQNKGYQFVTRVKRANFNFVNIGRMVTGREIRLHWGVDWFDLTCQAEIFNFMSNTSAVRRDLDTYTAIESILRTQLARMNSERRNIFDNFTVTLPDPMVGITQTEIISGLARLQNAYQATVISAIDKFDITGDFYFSDQIRSAA